MGVEEQDDGLSWYEVEILTLVAGCCVDAEVATADPVEMGVAAVGMGAPLVL